MQLSYHSYKGLIQISSETLTKKYKKKVEVQTLTLIDRSRAKSSRNAASDADDVKTDSFFSDDSETEIMIKKEGFGI